MPFRKACFTGHHYTGNSIAAAEKTFFFERMKKRTYDRIIIWPARPLKHNGTLYEPGYEEAFLPIGKRRPHYEKAFLPYGHAGTYPSPGPRVSGDTNI